METKFFILPIRDPDLVVFPGLFCEIDVGRDFSINAVEAAKAADGKILVAMQKDEAVDHPAAQDFHGMATEAEVRHVSIVKSDDGRDIMRVILIGVRRAILKRVGNIEGEKPHIYGFAEPIEEPQFELDDHLRDQVKQLRGIIAENFVTVAMKDGSEPTDSAGLSLMVDDISGQLPIAGQHKLDLLRLKDSRKRLDRLLKIVTEVVKQPPTDTEQPPAQPKQEEKGEFGRLSKLVEEAGMPEEARKVADQELRKLKIMTEHSSEYHVTANYIEMLASLPWNKSTVDRIDIDESRKCLDEDHYGLEKVKERILEFLAIRKLAPKRGGSILCLVGPPGTGKTSIGKSVARSMGRKFARLSLGGMHDEAEIRGHRRTYVGAMPGRILQNIRKLETNNPVFMLDEIDKLCRDYRGDPGAALLEVLDPEQNHSFCDNYANVPFDLSNVLFIVTANESAPIPPALLDRLEVIEIAGYSPYDKLKIAQNHLLPKQKEENGLKDCKCDVTEDAISKVIDEYTSEAGVRSLERQCRTILRKIAVVVASDKEPPATVDVNMIPSYLGPPKVFADRASVRPEIGLSTGLAWSRNGGSIMFVETVLTPGKGEIKLTGNLGQILQESVQAAHTWIRSNAVRLGVSAEMISSYDVHVHLPAGATPKDGPSAGIAIVASMLSRFLGRPVRNDIAVTGEISLRGRVLPIGGLKEKVLAAHRAGIKTVLHPKQNECDIEEIPTDVRKELELVSVDDLDQAVGMLLMPQESIADNGVAGPIMSGGDKALINREF
jgi:ATP-dependent Lon protease